MARSRTLLLVLVALLGLVSVATAAPQGSRVQGAEREARLERWKALSPAERAELERRFEALQRMPAEERARVVERAEKLRAQMESALESLDPERRRWVQSLEPRERHRVLRGLVADEARNAAARVRERLTPEEHERLESASHRERAAILRDVRRREFARVPEALDRLARELGLPPGAVQRAHSEDPEAARAALIDLVRRRARRTAERHGPPRGVEADEWTRVLELPDEAFARAWSRARFRDPRYGRPERPPHGPESSRRGLARELDAFVTPTLEQRAAAPGLAEVALRRRLLVERRAEAEALLVKGVGLDAEAAGRLRALSDDRFVRAWLVVIRTLRADGEARPAVERVLEGKDRSRGGAGPRSTGPRGRGPRARGPR